MAQLLGHSKTKRIQLGTDELINLLSKKTTNQFREVVAFYLHVVHDNMDVLENNTLARLELLTHQTKTNPKPKYPLTELYVKYPSGFRRAAIMKAVGQAQSWKTRYEKWQNKKQTHLEKNEKRKAKDKKEIPFTEHPPLYPTECEGWLSYYGTEFELLDKHHILLKFFTGKTYIKRKIALKTPVVVPEGNKMGSPTLVQKKHGWEIHIPYVLPYKGLNLGKVQERVKEDNFRMCVVDLGMNQHAVMTIQDAKGQVYATEFISAKKDNTLRKQYLDRIVNKQKQTKIIPEDERFCAKLWNKIANFNDNIAHRVSKRIVDFAHEHGARTIVFEHLGNLGPQKGKRSKRLNQRYAFWVKGRIVKYTKYKSVHKRIVCNRVSPYNSSRRCPDCGFTTIIRYSQGPKYGVSLAHCTNCKLHDVNSDFIGSLGIGRNFRLKYIG